MFKPAPDALPPQQGIKWYFFVPKLSFATVGIDPTSEKRLVFNYLLACIPVISLLTLCIPMAMYAGQYLHDMNLVTDALSPMWQSILAITKLILFMCYKRKIVKLVRTIWLWNLQAQGKELEILNTENQRASSFSIVFYIMVFATGVMALIAPFFIAMFYSWRGEEFWKHLDPPLKGIYIMDPKKSYTSYIFAYIWDVVGIYFVINGSLSTDSLFAWLTQNICAQFQILNLRLQTLAADDMATSHENFQHNIVQCVEYHHRIFELVDAFNEVFQATVCIKFAISCLQIACLAYQFARNTELASQIFHLNFLFSVSLQMALYCYGGQRLQDESSNIAVAIYEHLKWQNLNVKSRKLLMLILMRAQKSCKLNGIFFIADLRLFLWVYRTAGSFITMLMTMADND